MILKMSWENMVTNMKVSNKKDKVNLCKGFIMKKITNLVDASYGGSKVGRALVLKVHINEKINTRIKKTLKTNVEWALSDD